jgi:hypothetical protein
MILNLTQHKASPEQREDGVVDLPREEREYLKHYLTFAELPSAEILDRRAQLIVQLISGNKPKQAMIGGAPFFMSVLEAALIGEGIQPLYAFSKRESHEEVLPDGSVTKTQVFRHLGFVEAREG